MKNSHGRCGKYETYLSILMQQLFNFFLYKLIHLCDAKSYTNICTYLCIYDIYINVYIIHIHVHMYISTRIYMNLCIHNYIYILS